MPVRNARLGAGELTTANNNVVAYQVPDTNAAIIKHIGIMNAGSAASTVVVYIGTPGLAVIQVVNTSVNPSTSFNWSGWTVLNAGDQVFLYATVVPVYFWVAGAQLPYATP